MAGLVIDLSTLFRIAEAGGSLDDWKEFSCLLGTNDYLIDKLSKVSLRGPVFMISSLFSLLDLSSMVLGLKSLISLIKGFLVLENDIWN